MDIATMSFGISGPYVEVGRMGGVGTMSGVSVTDQQPGSATQAKERVLARLGEVAPDGRDDVVVAFGRGYMKRLSADQLADVTADELTGQIVGAFELVDRRSGDVAVRAFNPTLVRDGYQTLGSVVESNTIDSPFLFDSVHEELQARGLSLRRVIHPVIGTVRDPGGRLERVLPVREAETRESVMHFEVDRRLGEDELARLAEGVRGVLGDVRLAVRDFAEMRERVLRMIELARAASVSYPRDEVEEAVAFLRWLLEENFVFLGYREYRLVDSDEGRALAVEPGSGLGILSKGGWSSYEAPVPLARIEPGLRERIEGGSLLIYSKTNRSSTVHRRARMDYIGIRRVAPAGRIVGETRLVGLFTSKAYAEPASRTPLLQRKLAQIVEAEDLLEGSHDYKAVVALFESFPKDELFSATVDELRRSIMSLLALEETGRVRLLVRRDPFGRGVSLLVALPRERFSAELRQRLQRLFMRRFHGSTVDYHLSLGESRLAMIHFTVHVADAHVPDVSFEELEREVVALSQTWEDRLRAALARAFGPTRGAELFDRWARRFPEAYRTSTPPSTTVRDIEHLERLEGSEDAFVVGIANTDNGDETLTRVRLYKVGGKIQLSDFVPILEALGLRVVEEVPTQLLGEREDERYIHDFGVVDGTGRALDAERVAARVAECITAVWRGDADSDSLNRLVVLADLDWRQVAILRAYRRYHHKVNASFTAEYKNDAFAAHPEVAANLVRLFELRFDPARERDDAATDALRAEIRGDLDAITSLEQDRILRNHLGLIEATVRTNAYRPAARSLAFKFRSADVPEMPKPKPLYEIFVHTTEMEGIHLRGGRVARGGIRWSDRRQDYRTEVLGLMKAQMVKNAVIVPTGSKGGFVLKRPVADPTARERAVVDAYVTFMRGLLDLTDNLVRGEVVHPPDVVIHDEDDPYLVVAADKGTAALSDTANAVAAEYAFWLGDAFASGGSTGYDHKALGITARGAWESVKQQFREIGTDPNTQPVTVVGIGDMSGDVFGNGMLLSDQLCLVAAFDHRHMFLDPNPNPAAGFAERQRLFHLVGSSWDDYDRGRISAGGGVWPRSAKSIPLSPEVRGALAVEGDRLAPDELIRAILRAPVDLLWNGGIGTYVKAASEDNEDVGDRVNDGVRVNGADLRCRVVAEGGNLGFTQLGRVEYAMAGGRINADFIDNSAGVDSSDHEVNLKILLGLAMQRDLGLEDRNALLREVEDDVVRHVLYDNFLQAQILSQEVQPSSGRMEAYEELMQGLEAGGLLERGLEALPTSDEMGERRRAGAGMARPELALLLAYAKLSLKSALLSSSLPDSGYLERDVRRYFPPPVVARFGDLVPEHPLRRELVATLVANDVVNSQGITFVSRLAAETGAGAAEVIRAYRIARDVTGAVERWESIEALVGAVEPSIVDELMRDVDRLVEAAARWYLGHAPGRLGRAIDSDRQPFRAFAEIAPTLGSEGWRHEREREAWRLTDAGVPDAVARRHVYQPLLVQGPAVVDVARRTGAPVAEVARAFMLVGDAVFIDRLEAHLSSLPATSRWNRWAIQALWEDLALARRELAERVLVGAAGGNVDEAIERFLAEHAEAFERLSRFMRTFALEDSNDVAAVTVAVRKVRALAI
jgi:glutamate dehydrogenase